ncbi:MAG: hypothetical protein WCV79_02345 [Candidatus Paceibacterota bacterium]|jgi:hypothetical protein
MNPELPPEINVAPTFDVSPAINEIYDSVVSGFPGFLAFIKSVMGVLVGISIPISIFFFIVIIYCVEQLKRIRIQEEKKYDRKIEPAFEVVEDTGSAALAAKWRGIKEHIASENPNDWRQAIIDADIILDSLLTRMGYRGDSIGEKLKRVEKGDFATLNEAWEAHKFRNRIAHEGSALDLNRRDAQTAIDQYRKVFEEFYYI